MMRAGSLAIAIFIVGACSSEHVDVGVVRSAVNGDIDTQEQYPGVVGMFVDKGAVGIARCTGVLIAPNLVLTARHCVSPTTGSGIVCGKSPLGAPFPGMNVAVTTKLTMPMNDPMAYVKGARVAVPPEGNDECGFDIAAIVFPQSIAAMPYEPRFDDPNVGEVLTAVGYGTDGTGAGLGTRRVKTGSKIVCVGKCSVPEVQPTEFLATDGYFCRADSGSPAFDASGKVIGITSKGIDPCNGPILESVPANAEWIKSVAIEAANEGGYAPAPWTGAVVDSGAPPMPSDSGAMTPPPPKSGGCNASGSTPDAWIAMIAMIALSARWSRPRSRRGSGPRARC